MRCDEKEENVGEFEYYFEFFEIYGKKFWLYVIIYFGVLKREKEKEKIIDDFNLRNKLKVILFFWKFLILRF